jgi:excisionase family DNA binding protein
MEGDKLVEGQSIKAPACNSKGSFEPLLNCREAAELLRVHPKTVLKMARAGQLPGIRFGKLWRFRTSDLDVWLASRVSCDNHQCRSGK